MPPNDLAQRAEALNARYRHHSATSVLSHALRDPEAGKLALVSSFGAESVVLLHMVAVAKPDTPVIFIDTQMLFTETLVYQQEVCERLGLRDVRVIRASEEALNSTDPAQTLYRRDTDACCALRKTQPLNTALQGFDGWITGRKRFQGATRAALDFFEVEDGTERLKVNPLAHWTPEDIRTYMEENRLPKHPLVARGYPSIGCQPCTAPVAPGQDPRAGRWPGQQKTECGIHFKDGKLTRTGENA
jgi:phosphoadenosine phosphosulfate reductase